VTAGPGRRRHRIGPGLGCAAAAAGGSAVRPAGSRQTCAGGPAQTREPSWALATAAYWHSDGRGIMMAAGTRTVTRDGPGRQRSGPCSLVPVDLDSFFNF
jgi:hypothetical protein